MLGYRKYCELYIGKPLVYKMIVNEKYIYIGATCRIHKRIDQWHKFFRGKTVEKYSIDKKKNYKILKILHEVKSIKFEVLQLCHNKYILHGAGAKMTKKYIEDPNCLNIYIGTNRKRVFQYNVHGEFIKSHISYNAAAKYCGMSVSQVRGIALGLCKDKYVDAIIFKLTPPE